MGVVWQVDTIMLSYGQLFQTSGKHFTHKFVSSYVNYHCFFFEILKYYTTEFFLFWFVITSLFDYKLLLPALELELEHLLTLYKTMLLEVSFQKAIHRTSSGCSIVFIIQNNCYWSHTMILFSVYFLCIAWIFSLSPVSCELGKSKCFFPKHPKL